MTKEQIQCNFADAITKYMTVDAKKHDQFGTLIQGFIGIKQGKKAHMFPFNATEPKDSVAIIDMICSKINLEEATHMGVSFVKQYMHYSYVT